MSPIALSPAVKTKRSYEFKASDEKLKHISNFPRNPGKMTEPQQSSSDANRISLDKIIEAMTADLENSAGCYMQFGVNPQQSPMHNWVEYAQSQVPQFSPPPPPPPPPPLPPLMGQLPRPPIYMQQEMPPPYEPPTAESPIYFPSQAMNHLEINENNDLVGTIDVGGGNFINVIYGNASQIMASQQMSGMGSYGGGMDREYGLFGSKMMGQGQQGQQNGKRFIENLVGNWAPNQSGTYTPFGSSPTPELQVV